MKLTLIGHDDRYAVEQLQMALFSTRSDGEACSSLHRGPVWLTAVTTITVDGKTVTARRRLKTEQESVRLRRKLLQQCYYAAALPLLPEVPQWGALAGVRPTKLSTRHLLEGGTESSAAKQLETEYFVSPERSRLAVDCSVSTVRAYNLMDENDISLYVGIPFCPTRCSYCSFVSRTIGKKTELLNPYLEALLKELEITGNVSQITGNAGAAADLFQHKQPTSGHPGGNFRRIQIRDAAKPKNRCFDASLRKKLSCLHGIFQQGSVGQNGHIPALTMADKPGAGLPVAVGVSLVAASGIAHSHRACAVLHCPLEHLFLLSHAGRTENLNAGDLTKEAHIKNTMVGALPRYFRRIDGAVNDSEFLDLDKALVTVNGSNNSITNINNLAVLKQLNYVDMDYNAGLQSISALADCRNLIEVNVYGTKVTSVKELTSKGIVVNYKPA